MSGSSQLRKSHTDFGGGKRINSTKSAQQEKCTVEGTRMVFEILKETYPGLSFRHDKKVKVSSYRPSQFDHTFIQPDGGVIWASREGKPDYCVLITEAKHQGTNDQRLAEGLKPQARGNAVERIFKNHNEINWMLLDRQPSFPYAAFISGDDFSADSSIRDRVSSLCGKEPLNTVIVSRCDQNQPRASVFMRVDRWASSDVCNYGLKVATKAIAMMDDSPITGA